jgi:hypothetical protein
MAKLTNKYNLPAPLVAAVSYDNYSAGRSDYTTTQLAGTPARQLMLRRKHRDDIVEDVADRIYSLSGQSKHVVLERAAQFIEEYEYLAEQRFYIQRAGKTIGGQIDLYDKLGKTLYDWKECSVYVSTQTLKPEWERQANINRLILEENNMPVEKLINIALYRDWKKSQVSKENYPPHQVEQFSIPVWPTEQTERFISQRLQEFERAANNLPLCSDEERWKAPDVYAVYKGTNKRASKLFDTEQDAIAHIQMFNLNDHNIQVRLGVNRRCKAYCDVASFCDWWQQNKGEDDGITGDS